MSITLLGRHHADVSLVHFSGLVVQTKGTLCLIFLLRFSCSLNCCHREKRATRTDNEEREREDVKRGQLVLQRLEILVAHLETPVRSLILRAGDAQLPFEVSLLGA